MTSPPASRLGPSGLADQPHLTGTRAHQRERALIRYRKADGTSASLSRVEGEEVRFASDSPLEQRGCEPLVPRERQMARFDHSDRPEGPSPPRKSSDIFARGTNSSNPLC